MHSNQTPSDLSELEMSPAVWDALGLFSQSQLDSAVSVLAELRYRHERGRLPVTDTEGAEPWAFRGWRIRYTPCESAGRLRVLELSPLRAARGS